MDAFARWLTRHPLAVVVANLAVTAVLGLYALHIRIENSLESMLPAGDPKVAYYNTTRALFGSDDVGVIGVRADDVFAPSTIVKIARVTDALAKVPGVESVLSITNVVDPTAYFASAARLLPRIPPTPDEVEALKRKLAATPLVGKNLIADNFRGAAIVVFFENLTDAQYLDLGVDRRIMDLLAAENGPEALFYTGAAHVKQAAVELMRRDIARFTPIALALMLLVLWLSFRTVRGISLPILAVAMALVWTLGVIVLAGKALTFGTSVLPPLLLVVGSSYAIHVMARYYEQVDAGAPPDADFLYYFEPGSEVRRANETINREIIGSNPFYIIVEGGAPGVIRRWEVLKLIKDLQDFLGKLPGVTSSLSVVDYLETLETRTSGQPEGGDLVVDEQGNVVPAEQPKPFWQDPKNLEPLLETIDKSPGTLKSVVTPDFRTASILVRTSLSGSRRVEETLDRIRLYVAEHFPADIAVNLTGTLVLLTGTASDIVAGQIKSLTLALGIIFLVMTAMFLF